MQWYFLRVSNKLESLLTEQQWRKQRILGPQQTMMPTNFCWRIVDYLLRKTNWIWKKLTYVYPEIISWYFSKFVHSSQVLRYWPNFSSIMYWHFPVWVTSRAINSLNVNAPLLNEEVNTISNITSTIEYSVFISNRSEQDRVDKSIRISNFPFSQKLW